MERSSGYSDAVVVMERCILDIRTWMLTDKLKLNDDKTEFMLIGTKQQQEALMLLLSLWREM